MTYFETTEWLYTQLPVYQLQGSSAYKPGLEKISAFMDYLGNPHLDFKSIHVAGTNGKGSTSHMIASALQEVGYKVGLYTSPHLIDFSERIKLNGTAIPRPFVIDFVQSHKTYFLTAQLSFFEITVGMSYAYFSAEKVDYAVVEVGLGGRLDATNIIVPTCSVITNIGLDHTQYLGTTLAEIASEKGGIIKPNIPVVIGEKQAETTAVFTEISTRQQAALLFSEEIEMPVIFSDLKGVYQEKNRRTAYAVLRLLLDESNLEKSLKGFEKVIKNTGLRGRWEKLGDKPTIIADVTHNKDGFDQVIPVLKKQSCQKMHIVLGFVKEKEIESILSQLPTEAKYYACAANSARSLSSTILGEMMEKIRLDVRSYDSVKEAFESAKSNASEEDFIYVGGSTFVIAEIL